MKKSNKTYFIGLLCTAAAVCLILIVSAIVVTNLTPPEPIAEAPEESLRKAVESGTVGNYGRYECVTFEVDNLIKKPSLKNPRVEGVTKCELLYEFSESLDNKSVVYVYYDKYFTLRNIYISGGYGSAGVAEMKDVKITQEFNEYGYAIVFSYQPPDYYLTQTFFHTDWYQMTSDVLIVIELPKSYESFF